MQTLPIAARVYVVAAATVAVTAFLLRVPAGVPPAGTDWLLIAELFVLALAAKQFPLEYAPKRKVSLSGAIYFLVVLHCPEVAVRLVFLAEVMGHLILRARGQRGMASVIFNTAQHTLSAVVALSLFRGVGDNAAGVVLAGTGTYLTSSTLVAGMVALTQKKSLWQAWSNGRRNAALQGAILLGVAAVTHYAIDYPALVPLLMAFPAAMVYTIWRAQRERDAKREAEIRLAAETEKAQVRGEFLSLASHELRTPITTLKGYAWQVRTMVGRGDVDAQRVAERVATIDKQATRLCTLIEQLLDVSRIESGKLRLEPKGEDLAERVARVVADMRVGTGRWIEYEGPQLLESCFDGVRFDQVVMNLVSNAVKFSPADRPITVSLADEGEVARLSVRDHGSGIPAHRLPHIFERYYQGHGGEAVGGLGIGLYVSREIIEMHGGTIVARNHPDGGAEFAVRLPFPARALQPTSAPALAPMRAVA